MIDMIWFSYKSICIGINRFIPPFASYGRQFFWDERLMLAWVRSLDIIQYFGIRQLFRSSSWFWNVCVLRISQFSSIRLVERIERVCGLATEKRSTCGSNQFDVYTQETSNTTCGRRLTLIVMNLFPGIGAQLPHYAQSSHITWTTDLRYRSSVTSSRTGSIQLSLQRRVSTWTSMAARSVPACRLFHTLTKHSPPIGSSSPSICLSQYPSESDLRSMNHPDYAICPQAVVPILRAFWMKSQSFFSYRRQVLHFLFEAFRSWQGSDAFPRAFSSKSFPVQHAWADHIRSALMPILISAHGIAQAFRSSEMPIARIDGIDKSMHLSVNGHERSHFVWLRYSPFPLRVCRCQIRNYSSVIRCVIQWRWRWKTRGCSISHQIVVDIEYTATVQFQEKCRRNEQSGQHERKSNSSRR
jgi:hypothetical protein